jgi:hypothetical protein
MSGHVFHPGHEELHGVTVVVEGPSGRTWVGRYHERNARGVMLHDVATHDPATATLPRDAWVARLVQFGIRVDTKHLVVPNEDAGRVIRLAEWGSPVA